MGLALSIGGARLTSTRDAGPIRALRIALARPAHVGVAKSCRTMAVLHAPDTEVACLDADGLVAVGVVATAAAEVVPIGRRVVRLVVRRPDAIWATWILSGASVVVLTLDRVTPKRQTHPSDAPQLPTAWLSRLSAARSFESRLTRAVGGRKPQQDDQCAIEK
ncbi:MAG: hypothetical protein ACI9OJ_002025 [Myxococcota bacterium]|jgi:hypothetical protein